MSCTEYSVKRGLAWTHWSNRLFNGKANAGYAGRAKQPIVAPETIRSAHQVALFFFAFHSVFATRIRISSSLTGICDVSVFITFSKSESSKISRVASMRAIDVACSTSRSASPKPSFSVSLLAVVGALVALGVSPSNRKTSHTRNCAGNGMEMLKIVKYQRVAYAVEAIPSSSYSTRIIRQGLCSSSQTVFAV